MAKAKKNKPKVVGKRQTIINDFVIIPNNESMLSISMAIGDTDQTGSTRIEVRNDATFPVKNIDGTFDKEKIRSCKKMDNKALLIITSVTDTNKDVNNNRTEATLDIFVGDIAVYHKSLEADVTNEGDTETFIFNIDCYALD